MEGLQTELWAQVEGADAQLTAAQQRQASAGQAAAAAEQATAAAESSTLPMSRIGQATLNSKAQQRENLLGRLQHAKRATSHLVPTSLARLRGINVHHDAYAPMTTGTSSSSALNAPGRAAEENLDMLLATHQLDGEGVTERGTGCDDPGLLGQVLSGILVGQQIMQPTLYRQTINGYNDSTSTVE